MRSTIEAHKLQHGFERRFHASKRRGRGRTKVQPVTFILSPLESLPR